MRARLFVAITGLALVPMGPALADIYDEAEIDISFYEVSGETLDEVQADMEANGPEGFWAYTTWNTNWRSDCRPVTTAEIVMPVLADDAPLSEADRDEFERMAEALLEHELGHVRIGLNFGADVVKAGCPRNTDDILQHWTAAEKAYDVETDHGYHEGVYLAED